MDIQEEVEDCQGALDAGCLQRVIAILAALVQVSSGLVQSEMYKSDQEMILTSTRILAVSRRCSWMA